MNKAILMGRLTRDPEVRTTQSQIAVASFTLAVDRRFKNAAGEREADFIPVTCWRGLADLAGKYLTKGTKIIVVGAIQTSTYEDKDGKKVYKTEIVADEIEFAESKKSQGNHQEETYIKKEEPYIEDEDSTELPFDL